MPGLKLAFTSRDPSIWTRIEISFPESVSPKPLDGHILLGISTNEGSEPRRHELALLTDWQVKERFLSGLR